MSENKNRPTVGIVGLQDQGKVYANVLSGLGVELNGADVSERARTEFEERYGAATYETLDELFETAIDSLVVTSPNKYHEQPTIAALQRGYDVFVEKPLAHSLESAKRIVEVEAEVDSFCMVGSHFKLAPSCRLLKQYIDDGYFGEIYHVEAKQTRRRGIPGRGSWYTSKDIAGGGAAMDIGIHAVDLALDFLAVSEIEEMMSVTRTKFGHREDYVYRRMHSEEGKPHRFDVEDSVTALMRTDEGATTNIEIAWAANGEPRHEYHIHGTNAGAYLDLQNSSFAGAADRFEGPPGSDVIQVYEARDAGSAHFFDGELQIDRKNPFVAQFEYFLDAVAADRAPDINSATQALNVQRVISKLYE